MLTQTTWKNPTAEAVKFDYFVGPGVSHVVVLQPGEVRALPSDLDLAIRTPWGGGLAPQLVQVPSTPVSLPVSKGKP